MHFQNDFKNVWPLDCWDCGFESHSFRGALPDVCLCVCVCVRARVHELVCLIVCDLETSEWGGPCPILAVAPQKKKKFLFS